MRGRRFGRGVRRGGFPAARAGAAPADGGAVGAALTRNGTAPRSDPAQSHALPLRLAVRPKAPRRFVRAGCIPLRGRNLCRLLLSAFEGNRV